MKFLLALILEGVLLASLARAQSPGTLPGMSDSTPDGEEIVRRAIARRVELRRSISLTATVHTKSIITISNDSSKIAAIGDRAVAYESVGRYHRDPGHEAQTIIIAQRQTTLAPGPARNLIESIQSIGRTFSVDDERIILMNRSLPSPLAEDAPGHYVFQLSGRAYDRDGKTIYSVDFHPASSLHPGFVGTLGITGESYDLVEMELRPSQETVIPFVRELHLHQTFSPLEGGGYQPEAFDLKGEAVVRAVSFGIVEPHISFTLLSRFTNRRLNAPMFDPIRTSPGSMPIRDTIIYDSPDSLAKYHWNDLGIGSVLTKEQIESIEKSRIENAPRFLSFSVAPYIDYNRAGATSLGIAPAVTIGPATIGGMGGYSFGLSRPIGEASIALSAGREAPVEGTLRASTFSQIATTTTGDRSNPRIMNTLVAASLHQDYYDFYRKDGWSAGADLAYEPLRLAVTFEQSRQFSIGNNARWALLTWKSREFPENPPIADGSYQTVQADLAWGKVTPFLKITPVEGIDLRWSLTGLLGSNRTTDTSFRLAEALLSLSIPVMRTGYNPITLTLLGAGGIGDSTLPPQYQFRLRTSAASFGKPGGFVSPPKGLYGGTEYLALGAEVNLTDLWWRALGLPVYEGRGLELILAGGSARYRQHHFTGYVGTGDQWYSEVGFALSRIPLFITDLVAGRADARWGLGPLGKFNANFTFVLPL